jgi:succinate dehydrogenase / fumarate reductase, cytochrome b subunit
VAIRVRKSKDDYGSIYKGHEGQWSWMLHRITGVAVILFLFVHVVDTSLVGWGPEAYNRVTGIYENVIIRLLELGLVAAVLYHGINGLKITLIDFFPGLVKNFRTISFVFTGIFILSMIPVTIAMLQQTWDLYQLDMIVGGR